jgi:hypothetical protein
MRRLSVSSETSESFEFVSPTPSVNSVNGGGVSVCSRPAEDGGCAARTVECRADEQPKTSTSAPVVLSIAVNVEKEQSGKDTSNKPPIAPEIHDEGSSKGASDEPDRNPPRVSPYWYQFVSFVPESTASFGDEFARLSKHQGWSKTTGRKRRAEALLAELVFHFGDSSTDRLRQMQKLCKICQIKNVPSSITQCKLVSK